MARRGPPVRSDTPYGTVRSALRLNGWKNLQNLTGPLNIPEPWELWDKETVPSTGLFKR